MSAHALDAISPWTGAYFAAGVAAGLLYFIAVRRNAIGLAEGGRVSTAILLAMGRLALLGGLLTFASLRGAPPLLAMALGVFVARPLIMRGLSGATR